MSTLSVASDGKSGLRRQSEGSFLFVWIRVTGSIGGL